MGIDPVTHRPRVDLLHLSSILNNPSLLHNSRILGAQTIANPHLLRLAAAAAAAAAASPLPSSSQHHHHNNLSSDNLSSQNANNVVQDTQLLHAPPPPLVQDFPIYSPAINSQITQQPNGEFGLENFPENDYWLGAGLPESGLTQDYLLPPLQTYGGGYYEPAAVDPQSAMDPPAPLAADESNHFGFRQVWSTPSSSQVNSSSTTTTEDEREISYGSNLLNFDVANIFDVNEYSCNFV